MSLLHLALGEALVRIDCRHPEIEATLHAAWGPALEIGARAFSEGSLQVCCDMTYEEDATWRVDGVVRRTDPHYQDRVPQLESYIVRDLLPRQSSSLHLHAGCVSLGRLALVLCGPSGAGKSSMTRQAVKSGAAYLTDDCIVVVEGEARGVPRCIQFDGLEPEDEVPPYLADCDVDSYQSINERDVYRRIPLFRGPYRAVPSLNLSSHIWVVVKLVRGPKNAVRTMSVLERLSVLYESTVTTGRSYGDELGFGPTYELTWADPESAFPLLTNALDLTS